LRVIGEDETVAKHCGVNTTFAKVALFAISATVMTLVGAIMAPRWTYIEPSIAFNSMISFQVLIMALLGGAHRLWGPVLGAVPLTLLFELLSARFPKYVHDHPRLHLFVDRLHVAAGRRGPVRKAARETTRR
jgi:branched-chain amino acid transport system permease protein